MASQFRPENPEAWRCYGSGRWKFATLPHILQLLLGDMTAWAHTHIHTPQKRSRQQKFLCKPGRWGEVRPGHWDLPTPPPSWKVCSRYLQQRGDRVGSELDFWGGQTARRVTGLSPVLSFESAARSVRELSSGTSKGSGPATPEPHDQLRHPIHHTPTAP